MFHRYAAGLKFPRRLGILPAQADADDIGFLVVIGIAVGDSKAHLTFVIVTLCPTIHRSANHALPDMDIRHDGVVGNAFHLVSQHTKFLENIVQILLHSFQGGVQFFCGKGI